MVDNGVRISHQEAVKIASKAISKSLPMPDPALSREDLWHMAYIMLRGEREGQTIYGLAVFAPNPEAYMVMSTRYAVLKRVRNPKLVQRLIYNKRKANYEKTDHRDRFIYTPQMVRKALPYVFDMQPLREAGGYMPAENRPDEEVGQVTTPVDDTRPMDAVCMTLDLVQALPSIEGTDQAILRDFVEHQDAMASLHGPEWRTKFYRACCALAEAASAL